MFHFFVQTQHLADFGDCPVCNESFPMHRLPSHVENCLNSASSPPASALGGFGAAPNSPRYEALQKQRAQCPLCKQEVPALGLGLHVQSCRGTVVRAAPAAAAPVSTNPWEAELAAEQQHQQLRAMAASAELMNSAIGHSSDGLPVVVARKKEPAAPAMTSSAPSKIAAHAVSSTSIAARTTSSRTSASSSPAPASPQAPHIQYANLKDLALASAPAAPVVMSPADNLRELRRLANASPAAGAARSSSPSPAAAAPAAVAASSSASSSSSLANQQTVGRRNHEKVQCGGCLQAFDLQDVVFLEACEHTFCAMCLRRPVVAAIKQRQVAQLVCPLAGGKCKKAPTQAELRLVLSEAELDAFERLSVRETLMQSAQFVACVNPKCDNVMERVEFDAAGFKANKKEKGADGKVVPETLQRHKAEHRLRCPACGTDWCSSCSVTPYHEARTCEQLAQFKAATHCRFCGEAIKKGLKSKHVVFQSVCGSKECMTKKSLSCTKQLPGCGHACGGIRDEEKCLEQCLQCEPAPAGAVQTGDDFCPICYVEDLKSAPTIKLACGHMFHYECIRRKVAAGWPSSRITFTFLECPLCAAHARHAALAKLTAPHFALFALVREKALERLDVMKERGAKELVDADSDYFGKPDKYAMARYCYYPCFKCKKPYYGGEKACGAPVQAEDFSPKDLVCGACATGKNETCRKHGKEYIEYKCRFCCEVACFFCWGTTHFCEAHHKEAPRIAKVPVDQLPKCTCGNPHPPNGTEFCLGCSMCRLTEKRAQQR